MTQFALTTHEIATPESSRALRRAVARVAEAGLPALAGIELLETVPHLAVRIGINGKERSAAVQAEGIFWDLWYDAFGNRSVGLDVEAIGDDGCDLGRGSA